MSASIKIVGLKRLINRLEDLKKQTPNWVKDLMDKLADIGLNEMKIYYEETISFFGEAFNEDFGDIDYQLEWIDNSVSIVASGEKILFLEFGSGIFYNTLQHPLAHELGHEIGEYPYAKHSPSWGNREGWYYYKDNGIKQFTRGIEASKGMYYASLEIRRVLNEVAKEVWLK